MSSAEMDNLVIMFVGFIGIIGVGTCVFALLYILDKGFRDVVNKELRS